MIDLSYSQIVLSLLTGLFSGALFFHGLWHTVHKLAHSQRPMLLLATSLLLRMGLLMLALVAVLNWLNWQALILCLTGFLVARTLLLSLRGLS